MAQHENAWNMQALEGDDPNRKATGDPEEFTIVEGLQVRNALVWLAASVWATWAAKDPAGGSFVDDGPVLAALAALPQEIGLDPRHWDDDPNPTIVLYNPEALVVVDRNGGRVTHVFVLHDGVPRTVSGTFKSYQYRDRAGVECDGHVLQNTVWTPNHRYLGSDVDLRTQREVAWTYARPVRTNDAGTVTVGRIVPDNFNAYTCGVVGDGVRCAYDRGWAPRTTTQAELVELWKRDGLAPPHGHHRPDDLARGHGVRQDVHAGRHDVAGRVQRRHARARRGQRALRRPVGRSARGRAAHPRRRRRRGDGRDGGRRGLPALPRRGLRARPRRAGPRRSRKPPRRALPPSSSRCTGC